MEEAVAVAALLHLLDLLLLQLGLLRCPLNNPHEVPARQLTLQPTPSNLVLLLNRVRVLDSLDRCFLRLRKLDPSRVSSLCPDQLSSLILILAGITLWTTMLI